MLDLKNFVRLGKKIIGAGLNYKSIVQSRGVPTPKIPIVFLKPTTSYIMEGQWIEVPTGFDVHHEIELGVIMGKRAKNLSLQEVKDHIGGYCLALDLTAVDQLAVARQSGTPWTLGKGFDSACPVSCAVTTDCVKDPDNIRLWCTVNDEIRQDSRSPTGVGPIRCGDVVKGGLGEDLLSIEFWVK